MIRTTMLELMDHPPTLVRALEVSIMKWSHLVRDIRNADGDAYPSAHNCALCYYTVSRGYDCTECPLYSHSVCAGGAYGLVQHAIVDGNIAVYKHNCRVVLSRMRRAYKNI